MNDSRLTTAEDLRAQAGPVAPLVAAKVLHTLDVHATRFIALSPFVVIASSGPGGADASPRGDAPGFVRVLGPATLLIPDRPGNRRLDSYLNLIDNPQIGLLFLVPGIDETLRVNGAAQITTDAGLLAPCAINGRVPLRGLVVRIGEVFFHCGKALIRSALWNADRHVPRTDFPSLGRIVADQTGIVDADTADRNLAESYTHRLY